MLCKNCKKNFIGDTTLCPKCEKAIEIARAKQTIADSIFDLVKSIKLGLALNSFFLLILIVIWIVFPLFWFVYILFILDVVFTILMIYREKKIWFYYKELIKSGDLDQAIDEVTKWKKGLYQRAESDGFSTYIRNRTGILHNRFSFAYSDIKFAVRTIQQLND